MQLSRWTIAALLVFPVLVGTSPMAAAKSHPAKSASSHKAASTSSKSGGKRATSVKPAAPAKSNASTSSSRASSGKASMHTASLRSGKSRKGSYSTVSAPAKPKFRGQQSIDSTRIMEIQQALIREHYLDGEPSGQWDQATRDAFIRIQTQNNWQTKIVPDSRALIKLGLGPSQQNLLNPETATVSPQRPLARESVASGNN